LEIKRCQGDWAQKGIQKREAEGATHHGNFWKGHSWKGKGYVKGDLSQGTQCFEVQRYVCELIPQPDICREVPMKPVTVCQPKTSDCNANEAEICTVSDITTISQECVEKCKMEKGTVCEDKEVEVCEDQTQTTCKVCEKIPKVTQECREKKTKECKDVTKVVDKPVIENICGPECFDVINNVCKQVPFQQCKPVEEEIIKQVSEEVCY